MCCIKKKKVNLRDYLGEESVEIKHNSIDNERWWENFNRNRKVNVHALG